VQTETSVICLSSFRN